MECFIGSGPEESKATSVVSKSDCAAKRMNLRLYQRWDVWLQLALLCFDQSRNGKQKQTRDQKVALQWPYEIRNQR